MKQLSCFPYSFLFAKDYRAVMSGWQKGTAFQGAGFKTGHFVEEKLGGATVEQFMTCIATQK